MHFLSFPFIFFKSIVVYLKLGSRLTFSCIYACSCCFHLKYRCVPKVGFSADSLTDILIDIFIGSSIDVSIDISINISIDNSVDMFIDIYIDMFIGISIDIFIEIVLKISLTFPSKFLLTC